MGHFFAKIDGNMYLQEKGCKKGHIWVSFFEEKRKKSLASVRE
jgi:hypothetical protein